MDCGPLNLAHFHERRAEKFLSKQHRYDEAIKAIEMSLLYLKEAEKNVQSPKSLEVLNTQRWDLQRKLQQIQIRRQQHERSKLKEIVPILSDNNNPAPLTPRPDANISIQSKSIDETIQDFHAKSMWSKEGRLQSEENSGAKFSGQSNASLTRNDSGSRATLKEDSSLPRSEASKESEGERSDKNEEISSGCEELPMLAPLELPPTFEFHSFEGNNLSIRSSPANMANLAGSFQK